MLNKRGQIETLIIAGLVIVVLTVGVFGSIKITAENRYVGNINSNPKLVYDLKHCDIREISSDRVFVSFSTKEDAYNQGYEDASCNA